MEYKEIKKLMDDFGDSKIDGLNIEFPDGTKIKLKKNSKDINDINKSINEIKDLMRIQNNYIKEKKVDLLNVQSEFQNIPNLPQGIAQNITQFSEKKGNNTEENNTEEKENKAEEKKNKTEENLREIKSPMVGTFYASSSPKEKPYVKLGDKVKKGDVLGIIEAMKLMNEIESDMDGEIAEICVKNEDPVEYGTVLFKIK